jgi:hypothetical protein
MIPIPTCGNNKRGEQNLKYSTPYYIFFIWNLPHTHSFKKLKMIKRNASMQVRSLARGVFTATHRLGTTHTLFCDTTSKRIDLVASIYQHSIDITKNEQDYYRQNNQHNIKFVCNAYIFIIPLYTLYFFEQFSYLFHLHVVSIYIF